MAGCEVKEVLSDLISFRTVSSESNLDCITYIKNHLDDLGARIWVQPDKSGTKANLLATVGPSVPGGVLLSGQGTRTLSRSMDRAGTQTLGKQSNATSGFTVVAART